MEAARPTRHSQKSDSAWLHSEGSAGPLSRHPSTLMKALRVDAPGYCLPDSIPFEMNRDMSAQCLLQSGITRQLVEVQRVRLPPKRRS
jgi:hypothetical protein